MEIIKGCAQYATAVSELDTLDRENDAGLVGPETQTQRELRAALKMYKPDFVNWADLGPT